VFLEKYEKRFSCEESIKQPAGQQANATFSIFYILNFISSFKAQFLFQKLYFFYFLFFLVMIREWGNIKEL
jgi:hypothetical protein